jgi:hypothetical protein
VLHTDQVLWLAGILIDEMDAINDPGMVLVNGKTGNDLSDEEQKEVVTEEMKIIDKYLLSCSQVR